MQSLYTGIFYNQCVNEHFTVETMLRYMLRFETALAQAQARHAVIPNDAATMIGECAKVENLPIEQLAADAALGANVAIPLVKQLTAVVKQKTKPKQNTFTSAPPAGGRGALR